MPYFQQRISDCIDDSVFLFSKERKILHTFKECKQKEKTEIASCVKLFLSKEKKKEKKLLRHESCEAFKIPLGKRFL